MPSRDRGRKGNIFEASVTSPTLSDVDSAIYGEIDKVDSGKQVARPIDIMAIKPDPTQPRRTIPSLVRNMWDGESETVPQMLANWWDLVQQERDAEFPLASYLLAEDDLPRPEASGPLENILVDLLELAASIRREKLTNPITVLRSGNTYLIETGERRWLAYQLLRWVFPDDEQWTHILAHTVSQFDVWRQATENTMRQNLNAISRARQLSILIMDLYQEMGTSFQSFHELVAPGGSDRLYYAQVADGNEYRIPRGKGEMLLGATGLKNDVQLRQYRDLLRLPDELWLQADDMNLSEGEIRKLKPKAKEPTPQAVAANESLLQIGPFEPPRAELSYLRNLDTSQPKNVSEIRQHLQIVRQWLDELDKKLNTTEPIA